MRSSTGWRNSTASQTNVWWIRLTRRASSLSSPSTGTWLQSLCARPQSCSSRAATRMLWSATFPVSICSVGVSKNASTGTFSSTGWTTLSHRYASMRRPSSRPHRSSEATWRPSKALPRATPSPSSRHFSTNTRTCFAVLALGSPMWRRARGSLPNRGRRSPPSTPRTRWIGTYGSRTASRPGAPMWRSLRALSEYSPPPAEDRDSTSPAPSPRARILTSTAAWRSPRSARGRRPGKSLISLASRPTPGPVSR